jgi:hypothetical protein
VSGQRHAPVVLTLGKRPRYPLHIRLSRPHTWSGHLFSLLEIEPRFLGRQPCGVVIGQFGRLSWIGSGNGSGVPVCSVCRCALCARSTLRLSCSKGLATDNLVQTIGAVTSRHVTSRHVTVTCFTPDARQLSDSVGVRLAWT